MRFKHNDPQLKERRRELRNHSTPEEIILWNPLRGNGMGVKFRRQSSIGPFIVDFYCPSIKLIVELDGSHHENMVNYDEERDNFLRSERYQVVRFPNVMIHDHLQKVLDIIQEHIFLLSEKHRS